MNFSQKDARWAGLPLGTSPYKMGPYGCLTTNHAQAFALAGYTVDPGTVVEAFNRVGAYTDEKYSGGPGLLLWSKVALAFPQYHWHEDGSGRYKFQQVIATWNTGRFEHWVLIVDGVYYDPIDGTTGLKANYRPTATIHSADIDAAPTPPEGQIPVKVIFDAQRIVKVTAEPYLNLRPGPNSEGESLLHLPTGHSYYIQGYVHGEPVGGNDIWYITVNGHYFSAFYSDQPNV